MKKVLLITFFFIFIFGFSQTKTEIESLLNKIAENKDSKEITITEEGKKLISFGWKSLSMLTYFFTDQTETNVKSECLGRNLTTGEVAIIMADRIEGMPYERVTGIENCTLTFCEKNINLIEFYLPYIQRDGIEKFQMKYREWLASDDSVEWKPVIEYQSNRERKEIIREKKKAKLDLGK